MACVGKLPSEPRLITTPLDPFIRTKPFLSWVRLVDVHDPLGFYVINWDQLPSRLLKHPNGPRLLDALDLRITIRNDPFKVAQGFKDWFESCAATPGSLVWPEEEDSPTFRALLRSVGLEEPSDALLTIVRSPEVFTKQWQNRVAGKPPKDVRGYDVLLNDIFKVHNETVGSVDNVFFQVIYKALRKAAYSSGDPAYYTSFDTLGIAFGPRHLVLQYPRAIEAAYKELGMTQQELYERFDKPTKSTEVIPGRSLEIVRDFETIYDMVAPYGFLSSGGDKLHVDSGDMRSSLKKIIAFKFKGGGGLYSLIAALNNHTAATLQAVKERRANSAMSKESNESKLIKGVSSCVTVHSSTLEAMDTKQDYFDFMIAKRKSTGLYISLPQDFQSIVPELQDESLYLRSRYRNYADWSTILEFVFRGSPVKLGINRKLLPAGHRAYAVYENVWYYHPQTIEQVIIPAIDMLTMTHPEHFENCERELQSWIWFKKLFMWIKDPHRALNELSLSFDLDYTLTDPDCPVSLLDRSTEGRIDYLYEKGRRQTHKALAIMDEEDTKKETSLSIGDYDRFVVWYVCNFELPNLTTEDDCFLKLTKKDIGAYIAQRYLQWHKPQTIYTKQDLDLSVEKTIPGRHYTPVNSPYRDKYTTPMEYALQRAEVLFGSPIV